MMTIQELQQEAWAIADGKGWHDTERSFGEWIALMHSELSEALEEYRKPEQDWHAIARELADVIIWIADCAAMHQLDISSAVADKMTYNKTRSYRHGGKVL